jgi:hypothetical protein
LGVKVDSTEGGGTFPGLNRIYCVMPTASTGAFTADIDFTIEEALAALAGTHVPLSPVSVRWVMGRAVPQDILWTRIVSPLVVSSKVVMILKEEGATGWSTYPVRVTGKHGEEIPGFSGLSVRGRCGQILWERSMRGVKRYPAGVFPTYLGYHFDPETWDGSDFFLSSTEGVAVVFCTEKVRDGLKRQKVSGALLERADLVERSTLR